MKSIIFQNRRNFISGMSALGTLTFLEGCKPRSASGLRSDNESVVRQRVSLGVLEKSDPQNILANYNFAVGKMNELGNKNNPPVALGEPRSWYYQANIHNEWCPHNNWFFLPWHRAYLHYFEEVVRSILLDFHPDRDSEDRKKEFKNWSLPYWDWTLYKTKKGTGELGFPDSFLDKTNYPNLVHRRQMAGPTPPVNSVGEEVMKKILNINDFIAFGSNPAVDQHEESGGGELERAPHNSIHGWVGGRNADMADFYSPLDPIFWLHHCNVDRLWSTWTELHQTQVLPPVSTPSKTDPGKPFTRDFYLNFALGSFYDPTLKQSVKSTIQDVYDKIAVGYSYDNNGFGRIKAAGEATPKTSATARGFGNPLSDSTEAAKNVATVVYPPISVTRNNINIKSSGSNYSFRIPTVVPANNNDQGYNLKEGFQTYQNATTRNGTIRLNAENIPVEKSKSFSFHVFLKSDQSDETSIAKEIKQEEVAKSKHYVGTFSFFLTHADHAAQGVPAPVAPAPNAPKEKMKFVFDLTQTLDRIYPKGIDLGNEITFYVTVRSLGNSREILNDTPYDINDFNDLKLTFEYIANTDAK